MKWFRKLLDRFGLDRRSAKTVSEVCLIAGIVLVLLLWMFLSWSEGLKFVSLLVGFAVALFGAMVYIAYSPCPHCEERIDIRHADALYCPHCGKELD